MGDPVFEFTNGQKMTDWFVKNWRQTDRPENLNGAHLYDFPVIIKI
jgi:hypothetical protein